ncbi:hypothetical protein Tco_0895115 [Tanacetum coccineum]|uniref:Uncharacterized protein n=1 Tax=Tanacetum coccineum TaxID=301880 RepID=A0ABQ5CEV9_9ASTR
MATMAENVLVAGKENEEMLLDSVHNGPFQFREITIPSTESTTTITRMHQLSDLTLEEKTRRSCDIKATNIILLDLKQNEKDANEVQTIRQRFPDPLALIANTYNPPPSYNSQNS